jgi:hypothetical protein
MNLRQLTLRLLPDAILQRINKARYTRTRQATAAPTTSS